MSERAKYLPQPATIRKLCEQIREGWTANELIRREGGDPYLETTWLPPGVVRGGLVTGVPGGRTGAPTGL